jgi:hypothetical protein
MINNTIPKDIIQIENKCYQYINTTTSFEIFSQRTNPRTFILDYCVRSSPNPLYKSSTPTPLTASIGYTYGHTSCGDYFKEVSCNTTSIVSSPECCAWYGYDFEILEQGDYKFIVCKEKNQLTTPIKPVRTGIGTKLESQCAKG